jgi:hypothetical protein
MITGCGGSGGTASAQGTGPRDPGQSASPGTCSPWAGLDDLFTVTTWLRQLIGDEVIFGAGTAQARRDGLAVTGYAESLGGLYKKTPEQLNTAANDAQSLAAQISRLCF